MTRSEVMQLIDKIVIHRPYFKTRLGEKILSNLIIEWTNIMEPYDYEDVVNNLDAFFRDENNYGREPDAYQLIRGIYKTKDKEQNGKGKVRCQFCGRVLTFLELQQHEARCRSVKYLQRLYEKYFNRKLADLEMLYNLADKEFNEKYIKVMERALPLVKNEAEKKSMSNVIETYYGRPPKFSIDEVL